MITKYTRINKDEVLVEHVRTEKISISKLEQELTDVKTRNQERIEAEILKDGININSRYLIDVPPPEDESYLESTIAELKELSFKSIQESVSNG